MGNKLKYIKTILFVVTALSIASFMTQNSSIRFQYNYNTSLRLLADLLCLCSILFLAYKQLKPLAIDSYFIIAMCFYFSILIPDLHVWLWLTRSSSHFIFIVMIHSLPIPILLHQTIFRKQIKAKALFISGLFICIFAILYDILFINIPYQDITPEFFEKSIQDEKIRNWLYYIGLVIVFSGLVKFISQKGANTRLESKISE